MKQQRDPTMVPYSLSWNERGKTVNDLQVFAMNLLVSNNQTLTLAQWMETSVFGHPLYSYGFWNLRARPSSSPPVHAGTAGGG